jgi:hypothetical protein
MRTTLHMLTALVITMLISERILACSTCMVGDPTLTLMGTEKPYSGRLRLSLDYFTRDEETGIDGINKRTIDIQQLSLNVAYAPNTRVMLGLQLPYVKRVLHDFNLSTEEAQAPGDVLLTAKFFLQDKTDHQQTYGLLAGVRLPTAKEQTNNGIPLDFDAQPGVGAAVYNAGAWYSYFNFPWLLYTTAAYHVMPNEGFEGFRAGDALAFSIGTQYATDYNIAWQLGFESRLSKKDTYYGVEDDDSGGFIGFIAPGLVYSVKTDVLLFINVKVPAIDKLDGNHEEGVVYNAGVTYDF